MLKVDDSLLLDIGLGALPPEQKEKILAQIYEVLEMRVGMTLARQMSQEQLQQFQGFVDSNDEAGALNWLETNFPNYRDVVRDELALLKSEIKANAGRIINAAGQPQQLGDQPFTPSQDNIPGINGVPPKPPLPGEDDSDFVEPEGVAQNPQDSQAPAQNISPAQQQASVVTPQAPQPPQPPTSPTVGQAAPQLNDQQPISDTQPSQPPPSSPLDSSQ